MSLQSQQMMNVGLQQHQQQLQGGMQQQQQQQQQQGAGMLQTFASVPVHGNPTMYGRSASFAPVSSVAASRQQQQQLQQLQQQQYTTGGGGMIPPAMQGLAPSGSPTEGDSFSVAGSNTPGSPSMGYHYGQVGVGVGCEDLGEDPPCHRSWAEVQPLDRTRGVQQG